MWTGQGNTVSGGVDIPVCPGLADHVSESESDSDFDSDVESVLQKSPSFASGRCLRATPLDGPMNRQFEIPNRYRDRNLAMPGYATASRARA
jgi:hypothetical protein